MDSGFTPQLLVEAGFPGLNVPLERIHVGNGIIVLNVHDRAIDSFEMTNEWIVFSARFRGEIHQVAIPLDAVIAIFTREDFDGLILRQDFDLTATRAANESEDNLAADETDSKSKPKKKPNKPNLRIVK